MSWKKNTEIDLNKATEAMRYALEWSSNAGALSDRSLIRCSRCLFRGYRKLSPFIHDAFHLSKKRMPCAFQMTENININNTNNRIV